MPDAMQFPESWKQFLHDYQFRDSSEVYTNGSTLIPSFRVEQMVEHYFQDTVPVVRKPVAGYEGYYEVDQFGRVFSCDRIIEVDDNGRKYRKPLSGKQLKQRMNNKGYKVVPLTVNGKTKTCFVHRLVAEAFIPNPSNLPMVNHKDEDKTNNFLENIEWCTASYNRTYGKAIEKHAKKIRGRESEKRVAVIQSTLGGTFVKKFSSITEAAKAMSGSTSPISEACKGKRKTAYGYLWEYDTFCSYGNRRDQSADVRKKDGGGADAL